MEGRKRFMRWCLAIVSIALAIRIVWAIAVPVMPISDCAAYDRFAHSIADGKGHAWPDGKLTAYWPVGTPLLYSLVYRLNIPGYAPVVVLNVAMGAAVVALTIAVARQWFDRKTALTAGWLAAFWPSQIQFTTVIASETPFLVFLLAALLAWQWPGKRPWRQGVCAGVFLAGASYIRPTALLIPFVIAVIEFGRHHSVRRMLSTVVPMLIIMAAIIAPWSIRNTLLFGRFTLISTNGGTNTWMGNNPDTTGFYQRVDPNDETLKNLTEADRDKELGRRAMSYITEYPGRFAIRSITKFARLHERETIGVAWNIDGLENRYPAWTKLFLKIVSQVYWMAMLVLGIVGIGALITRTGIISTLTHPATAIWMYFSAIHAITVIQDRYHFASIPCIAILAAYATQIMIVRQTHFNNPLEHKC